MIALFYLILQIIKLYSYVVIANVVISWLVAFNILNNESLNLGFVFSLLVLLICLYLVWLIFINQERPNKTQLISLSLILAGGFGNLFDRVFLGHVVDFIAITFNPYVFNLADVFITIGIVLYLINYFKVKEQNS